MRAQAAERRDAQQLGRGSLTDIPRESDLEPLLTLTSGPVVLHLVTSGFAACEEVDEALEELAGKLQADAQFLRCRIERESTLPLRWRLTGIPCLVFLVKVPSIFYLGVLQFLLHLFRFLIIYLFVRATLCFFSSSLCKKLDRDCQEPRVRFTSSAGRMVSSPRPSIAGSRASSRQARPPAFSYRRPGSAGEGAAGEAAAAAAARERRRQRRGRAGRHPVPSAAGCIPIST